MGILKRTDSTIKENGSNQDINFLKQNIKSDKDSAQSSDKAEGNSETQNKSTSSPKTTSPHASVTPSTPHKPPEADDNVFKELTSQIENQKKLIEEQKKKIETFESSIKKIETIESLVQRIESDNLNQLITKNQQMINDLSTRIESLEKAPSGGDDESLSVEDRALIKAGKYLEKQMENVQETFEKLDGKIAHMRTIMTEVDEKEHTFVELEDQLNKLQRKTESIIELELMSKSNEAIKNLEENKVTIMNESETVLNHMEEKVQGFENEIESKKQNALDSVESSISRMKDTEVEVSKTIDEKVKYDRENMKRVDEVVMIMNETVRKILGNETEPPHAPQLQ